MKIIKINAIWCPGCLVLNKVMKKIEEAYPGNEYVSYDYDMDYEEVEKLDPGKRLPVLIFYKDNKEIDRLVGEKTYEEISKVIDDNS